MIKKFKSKLTTKKGKQAVKKSKETAKIELETSVKPQDSSYSAGRFYTVIGVLALLIAGLIWKTLDIQVFDADRLRNEAERRIIRSNELPFTRGKILDRNNRFLSVSVPLYSIVFDPREYFDIKLMRNHQMLKALAKELNGEMKSYRRKIDEFIKLKNSDKNITFDARDIMNPSREGFWDLLARSIDVSPSVMREQVRNNPNSEFVRLAKELYETEQERWKMLADEAKIPFKTLMAKIYEKPRSRFISIVRHQSNEFSTFAVNLNLDTVAIRKEPRRFYPRGEELAPLLGFTDTDNRGKEGIEFYFDNLLVGKNGKEKVRRDAHNNVIEFLERENAYDPQDIVLSIDEELQAMSYREIKQAVIDHKAESGSAVIVDVQTGEILSMATFALTKKDVAFLQKLGKDTTSKAYKDAVAKHNFETFNPNNANSYKPELARNRAITDTFEPGSTVKPLVVLTALQNKVTYLDEVIPTQSLVVNGHSITDVAKRDSLTLTGILQKSSNIGVSRLALRLAEQIGERTLVNNYKKVGFGMDTGLGIGEQKGRSGDRDRWSRIELATLSYGYGLQVTPLQLARAYATLGSFGIMRPLSITKVDPPVIGERVLPEKNTKDVVRMMESVAQPGEGGEKAMVDGYRVAVKTGTAKKIEKGNYVDKYLAFTAGIAPASDPRFALVVLINDPKTGTYYGGAVAAPLFSKIMGYTLKAKNIKPDNLN